MAIIAPVVDGKLVDQSSPTKSKEKDKTSLDKNAFLQLLVAEMQNQDPLEPTTNTEYVSQLATFSSLEEMQNVAKSMDFQRASMLVGQEVYIKTVNAATGSTDYVHGNVDFITYENGDSYVSVNGNKYPLADVDSVYDSSYTAAYDKAFNWTVALNKLPSVNRLTIEEKDSVFELRDIFEKMTDYEKTFITKENQEKIKELSERMELIVDNAKKDDEPDNEEEDTDTETEETPAADEA